MSHNPFETTAKEHVRKITEGDGNIIIDDEGETKNTRQEAREIREFLKGGVAENPSDKKAREEALYKAIVEVVKKEPDATIEGICGLIFTDGSRRIFVFNLKEALDKKDEFSPLIMRLYLSNLAIENPEVIIKNIGLLHFSYAGQILEQAVFSAAERDPAIALVYTDCYAHLSYAKWVIERAAWVAAEQYPDVALEYVDSYKDQPYARSVIEKAISTSLAQNPGVLLAHVDSYKDLSYAKWILERAAWVAAEQYPDIAFQYVDSYKDQPYARSVIEKAISTSLAQNPGVLLAHVDSYKDLPHAEWVIEQAALSLAARDPRGALAYIDHHKDQPYARAVIEKATRTAAEQDPQVAFEYIELYKDQPYAREVIEKVARVAADRDPQTAFQYINHYKDLPYVGEVIEKAARTAAEQNPRAAFEYIDHYKDRPYASRVIEKAARTAAEKYPRTAFEYIKLYKDQPYAREVLITAVQRDTEGAFNYANSYKDKPYAKEILLIAADLDPWSFFDSSDNIVDYFTPAEWTELRDRCERYVLLVEESGGENLLPQVIQYGDFPFNKKLLRFSILKADKKIADFSGLNQSMPLYSDIPFKDFEKIFFSEPAQDFFKLHVGEFTYMNAISISKVVYRKLYKEGKSINDEAIRETLVFVAEERGKVASRELFGPHTKLILFAHEEKRFDTDNIINKIWKRSGGKGEDVIVNEKGIQMKENVNIRKEKVLQAIREIKSPTTILFAGHGSPENWAFTRNTVKDLNRSLTPSPVAINYEELGDALIASGHIADVNLIGDTCLAYDFLMNLFHYMESKGVKEKPYVSISAANKNQFGWGGGRILDSKLLEAFHKVSKDDGSITVNDFFKAESLLWKFEDPALFVGKVGGTEGYRFPWKGAIWPTSKSRSEPSDIPREVQSLPWSPSPAPEARPKHFLEVGGDYKLSGIERLV